MNEWSFRLYIVTIVTLLAQFERNCGVEKGEYSAQIIRFLCQWFSQMSAKSGRISTHLCSF